MLIRNYKSSRDISEDISEDQEDCVRSVVKKVKEDHSIKWRIVGNEKQLKFNQSVEARFDSAISAIEKKKLDKKELEEGKKLLSERQRLIKLADRSECGWATVSAYVTDDLTDTPEDERRISKTEKSAKKALDFKRKERNIGLNQVLLITNLIMILFLLLLIYASALTKLSSSFDSPLSFDKPHFCPDLSSGEEPASRVDGKDTGETTAPILFLQEHQISQPSDAFDFEKSSDSCLF